MENDMIRFLVWFLTYAPGPRRTDPIASNRETAHIRADYVIAVAEGRAE